jgi:8-oxo-dGTP diphosphatase
VVVEHAPGHPLTASVLLTDHSDRVLIVRAGDRWQLPGGIVETGESVRDAATREVREELGLTIDLDGRRLIAVEWIEATRPGRRDRIAFVFAGPQLTPADLDRIRLETTELNDWRMASRDDSLTMLHPTIRRRLLGPLQRHTAAQYLETRNAERTP